MAQPVSGKSAGRSSVQPRQLWKNPRIVGAAILFIASLIPYATLGTSPTLRTVLPYGLPIIFLIWVIVALERRVHRLRRPRERAFWHEVSFASVCALGALLAEALYLSAPRTAAVDILLSALQFSPAILLIYAIEGAPDRDDRPSLVDRQERLTRSSILCFLLFFVAYFDLAPRQFPTAEPEVLPGLVVHGGLYLYLIARLSQRLRLIRSPRWRQLYFYMSLAAVPPLVFQLVAVLRHTGALGFLAPVDAWVQTTQSLQRSPILAVSYLLWVVTAEVRYLDLPAPKPPRTAPKAIEYGTSSSLFILLWALAFPCVHLVFYSFGGLSPEHLKTRQGIVTLGLIILGGIALRQHWIIRQSSNELLMRRARAESALRKSEANVRLTMQRQLSAKELKVADERFAKFFRSSSNALLISTIEGARIMEANEHFESLSGYDRSALIASTVNDLELWRETDVQSTLVHAVRHGKVRNRKLVLVRRDGDLRTVLLSAEPLDLAGHACLLAVIRDVTQEETAHRQLDERNAWRRHMEAERRLGRWPRPTVQDAPLAPPTRR